MLARAIFATLVAIVMRLRLHFSSHTHLVSTYKSNYLHQYRRSNLWMPGLCFSLHNKKHHKIHS